MQYMSYLLKCSGVTVVLISRITVIFMLPSLFLSLIVPVPQKDLTDNTLKGEEVDGIGCVGYIGIGVYM